MYAIYADNELIYAPTLANEGYVVLSPKMTVELNKAGSLSFLLPATNPLYDGIQKLKTIITVKQDREEIFRGRVLHDEKDYYNRKDVYCEGELSFLLDSVVRPYEFTGDIPELFKKFLDNHNSQVEEMKQFKLGEITVTDPNNYINRSHIEYAKTFDEIGDKLINTHGGYLRPRLAEDGVRYLDYVEQYGEYSTQIIEFGKNLLDISDYISADEVFTVLIPLGAEQQDEDGNTSGRLTIASVNDGKDYIVSNTGVALFGYIWRTEKWDDVTLPSNLLTKGNAFLSAGIEMSVSLTVKAVDLHLIDVDTERIKLGDYIRVVSLPHSLDKFFLCSKITLDLVNPDQSEYSLGLTFKSLTEKQASTAKTTATIESAAQSTISVAQAAANSANEAVQAAANVVAEIEGDYVKTSVFTAFVRDISSQMSGYATKSDIPTRVSQLENDSSYLTEHQDLSGLVTTEDFEALEQRVTDLEGSTEVDE